MRADPVEEDHCDLGEGSGGGRGGRSGGRRRRRKTVNNNKPTKTLEKPFMASISYL